MKCEKCGQEFPHKKGRYCGTCNWNSPGFEMPDKPKRSYMRPTMAEFLSDENKSDYARIFELAKEMQAEINKLTKEIAESKADVQIYIKTADAERNIKERYKKALENIVHYGNLDSNFPQDGRMYDIAKEALRLLP